MDDVPFHEEFAALLSRLKQQRTSAGTTLRAAWELDDAVQAMRPTNVCRPNCLL
jgi:hypothetical protein